MSGHRPWLPGLGTRASDSGWAAARGLGRFFRPTESKAATQHEAAQTCPTFPVSPLGTRLCSDENTPCGLTCAGDALTVPAGGPRPDPGCATSAGGEPVVGGKTAGQQDTTQPLLGRARRCATNRGEAPMHHPRDGPQAHDAQGGNRTQEAPRV
ncbi:hypothetical protein VULLAG_LOCUS2972 [Vulpes lagopus]